MVEEKDVDKIKFVQTTVYLDNIVYNLTKIDRQALGELIEAMGKKNKDGYYPLMVLVAEFFDKVEAEAKKHAGPNS
jgi:hypothetical protein